MTEVVRDGTRTQKLGDAEGLLAGSYHAHLMVRRWVKAEVVLVRTCGRGRERRDQDTGAW